MTLEYDPFEDAAESEWDLPTNPMSDELLANALNAGDYRALARRASELADIQDANKPLFVRIAKAQYVQRKWLVSNWLPVGTVGILAGRGGAGKSRLALQLAYALATGGHWLQGIEMGVEYTDDGYEIPQPAMPVLYASFEDDDDEIDRRTYALVRSNGHQEVEVENLHIVNMGNLKTNSALWAMKDNDARYALPEQTEAAVKLQVAAQGYPLLIIDPTAAAFAANENDRAQVRAFMGFWNAWARENDCSVLMIAHPPKRGGGADDYFSGSTDWEASARFAWSLSAVECGVTGTSNAAKERRQECRAHEGIHILHLRKGNYAPPPPPFVWIKMENAVWVAVERPSCHS